MFQDDYKACNDKIKVDEQLKNRVKEAMEHAETGAREQPRSKMFYFTRVGIPTAAGLIVIAIVVNLYLGLLGQRSIKKAGSLKNYTSYSELYKDIENSRIEVYKGEHLADAAEGTYSAEDDAANIINMGQNPNTEHSDTNIQVQGVDEADIVKNDGAYLYILSDSKIQIVSADGAAMEAVSFIELPDDYANNHDYYCGQAEMYLYDNSLALLYFSKYTETTTIVIYDISDRRAPVLVKCLSQSGRYVSSRMIDGILYTISNKDISHFDIEEDNYDTYVPGATRNGVFSCIPAEDIYGCMGKSYYGSQSYEIVTSCNVSDPNEFISIKSVIGQFTVVYMNAENLYLCMYNGIAREQGNIFTDFSTLVKFSISEGILEKQASTNIPGCVLNQFSMDEYQGYFRIATTVDRYRMTKQFYMDGSLPRLYDDQEWTGWTNEVYILDGNLDTVGKVTNLAQSEQIYSVRFQGDRGYVVTFYQTDPLFEIDLSDPRNPKVTDALEITGVSDYLHSLGDNLLLGIGRDGTENGLTGELKLSMFRVNAEGKNEEIHKLVLENISDSEALYNHKAILIDVEKGLLAFPVYMENPHSAEDYVTISAYAVFSFAEESGFVKKGLIQAGKDVYMEDIRGLYIDQVLYVISVNEGVKACDMETCQVLRSLEF